MVCTKSAKHPKEILVCVCVFRLLSTKLQPPGGTTVTAPSGLRTPAGLWAIPSTEPGPQPLLVTYNLSSLALTPGEPTPYVCMYVSMVCGMYVGMYWVRRESTQVHREGGTVSSKGKTCSVRDHDGGGSQGAGSVRRCSGRPRVDHSSL